MVMRSGFAGIEGQIIGHVPVQKDFPLLDQLHDHDRGHRLGHRSDLESRVDRVRHMPLPIRLAECTLVHDPPLLRDEYGAVELSERGRATKERIDAGGGGARGFIHDRYPGT